MSNQSYLNVWCRDFSEERALDAFGALLATVPHSAIRPGFAFLTVHAVDASETPVLELDLRAVPLDAAGVIELARDHLHGDCSGEVGCYWDLFAFDGTTGTFQREPQPLAIFSHGEQYDNGWWAENGHLQVHLGFEHFLPAMPACSATGAAQEPWRIVLKKPGFWKPWRGPKIWKHITRRRERISARFSTGSVGSRRKRRSSGCGCGPRARKISKRASRRFWRFAKVLKAA